MGSFVGFVQQEESLNLTILVKDSSSTPVNADASPTYRVYGPTGLMQSGTGGLSMKDTAAISGATNASPIVISSSSHGLSTGTVVTITGVAGNSSANGTFAVTVLDGNSFSIPVAGNGAYTSGGVWNTTGLYAVDLAVDGANGYQAGETYTVLVSARVASVDWADLLAFTVT